MKILIISNGNGEDLIGSILAREIKKQYEEAEISVMPLVGLGKSYAGMELTILGKPKEMPSGGFLTSKSVILRDIMAGMLIHHARQMVILLMQKNKFDKIVCIGDVFCLLMGAIAKKKCRLYFLPTAKSNYIERHYPIEKQLIKRFATKVFPRDNLTAQSFQNYGVDTHFFGNVMMDAILKSNVNFDIADDEVAIGILPGSRKEAYENFQSILDVLVYLYQHIRKSELEARFLVAVAPTIKKEDLEEMLVVEGAVLNPRRFIFTDKFGDVLSQSNFVIGMAGTANEQAAGFGKPVFTWEGRGPQTCKKRIEDQGKLLGESLIVIEGTAGQKAKTLWKLVQKPQLYNKCKNNAFERMGSPGAAKRIVSEILK
ncbi:MAG TPA: hypothetical protein DF296_06740 [Candidatus Margulisbacteria bacterium]|nr:MAG: hypothetical protein A2X41_02255 [Candidatus Margulisbacteria bacterium GWE2_39_32]HCT84881.1 hypothetical protein [Candidatus Margulisiibacteriota bacterium]